MFSVIEALHAPVLAQLSISENRGGMRPILHHEEHHPLSQNPTTFVSTTEIDKPVTQFNLFSRVNDNVTLEDNHDGIEDREASNDTVILVGEPDKQEDSVDNSIIKAKDIEYQLEPSASSLLPSNFTNSHENNDNLNSKKYFKKPKVVLTLSLRSRDNYGAGSTSTNYRNNQDEKQSRSPFLFGNNVIRYDTKANRLIIPTSQSSEELVEIAEDEKSSAEGGEKRSSEETTLISVITEGPLLEVRNHTLRALKVLDKLRSLTNTKLQHGATPSATTTSSRKAEPWYGYKKYETLHPKLSALRKDGARPPLTLEKKDVEAEASSQGNHIILIKV